jgi:hypothetical protein
MKVSQKQEKGAAARMGAKLHSGSGSGHTRNDMHTDGTLIECKTVLSGNKQITLKADVLKSLAFNAAIQDKSPVLHIELDGKTYVMIPEVDYLTLRDT